MRRPAWPARAPVSARKKELERLRKCIRLDLDCADICAVVGAIGARRGAPEGSSMRALQRASAETCRLCATGCERHAGRHEHCKICAEVCRACDAAAPGSP